VDTAAHYTALRTGGTTTVVLPEGMNKFRVKAPLKKVWDWARVVVISEFLPNSRWSVGNAMQRNTTICALSRAMILIEARSSGGSIAAGKACLGLKIPLFASVYGDRTKESEGNRELLSDGARPLMKSRSTHRANIQPVVDIALGDRQTLTAIDTGKVLDVFGM
jgi:DNA processing protein